MSTIDLVILGGGCDDTREGFEKRLNVIIKRRLLELGLPELRRAAFGRAMRAMQPVPKADLEPALMNLVVDQSIDEVAQERRIMIARSRPLVVDRRSLGSAPLDQQASRDSHSAEVEEVEESRRLRERLDEEIGRLPAEIGKAFLMRMNDFTIDDIMKVQGVSRTTVFHRIRKAREILARSLRDCRPSATAGRASSWE